MADIKSVEERSRNMSAIKNKNTKQEVFFRKELFSRGYRYRKNVNNVYGHPDLYLAKYKTAIFVNGCFWHRHDGCKYAYIPKSRTDFWMNKFARNIERDTKVRTELLKNNVRCLIIWECTVKKMMRDEAFKIAVLNEVDHFLFSDVKYKELYS